MPQPEPGEPDDPHDPVADGRCEDHGDCAQALTAAARDAIGFADRDTTWDGEGARRSLQAWAREDSGEINWTKYGRGFLYVAPASDNGGHTLADFKLPFAKVVNGRLIAVFAAVQAAAAAVSGARGGLDIPSSALSGVKRRINALYARARAQFDDEDIESPLTAAAVELPEDPMHRQLVHLLDVDGNPWRPSADWFRNPELPEYTRVTVTADGRVYGHVGDWEATHISYQGRDVRMPRSRTDYQYFHRRAIETDSGEVVPVGQLTFGPGHARPDGSLQAAVHHYDATCSQGAVVHAGEDAHGIWVAGAILPHLEIPDRNALALADLSGDWRHDGRGLEMVGAHCVGVPGFLTSRSAEGQMMAMAADASPTTEPNGAVVHADDAGTVLTLIAGTTPPESSNQSETTPNPDTEPVEPADGADGSDTQPGQQPDIESVAAAVSEPEGGSDDDGVQARALVARRRMAMLRATRNRNTTVTEDPSCSSLTASIDAVIDLIDPADPDVLFARVLAARIQHGSSGSLVAASGRSLDREPGKNWVEDDPVGLPRLIRRVARHIERNGRPLSVAIPAAINWVKHICRTGDVENFRGLQRVNPVSRAAACRAVAEWNALKARH